MQNFTVAPGETVEFLVMAVDQAGNPREAIWSVTEKSDSEEESTTIYVNTKISSSNGTLWCNNGYNL